MPKSSNEMNQTIRHIIVIMKGRDHTGLANIIGIDYYARLYRASFHTQHYDTSVPPFFIISRNSPHGQQNSFSSHGPFDSSNKEHYDAWRTNPFLSFNRKRAYGIVFGLILLNFVFLR